MVFGGLVDIGGGDHIVRPEIQRPQSVEWYLGVETKAHIAHRCDDIPLDIHVGKFSPCRTRVIERGETMEVRESELAFYRRCSVHRFRSKLDSNR